MALLHTPPDVTILYKLRYLGGNVATSSKRHINAEGSHYMTIFGSQEANNNIPSCSPSRAPSCVAILNQAHESHDNRKGKCCRVL
jgi:hypothetical protein